MFGHIGAILIGALLVAWVAVAVVYAVKRFGRGYGPESFFRQ